MTDTQDSTYDASKIKVLPGIEGVRRRPAMYIGDTGMRGLHHLIEEVVANSIDEAMAGFCTEINVQINADGSVTIADNGRGIPVDLHPTEKKPAVEVIMTMLHAGGKFDHHTYKVSGGLHGVGVTVVNALSEWLAVEVRRGGEVHHQRYERGKTVTELKVIGKSKSSGTAITFKPDREIFADTTFHFDTIANRMRELAFLNRGIRITLRDERSDKQRDYQYEGGIAAFVQHLNEGKDAIHKDVVFFEKEESGIIVEVAMQYNDGYNENVFSFVNNINTIEGGTHLYGFRSALTRTINAYAKAHNLLKGDNAPQGEDVREGLTAVINVKVPDPQFEGQTKTKLGNREVQGIVEAVVNANLGTYFEENPKTARAIVDKAVVAAEARESARKARDLTRRKSALSSGSLPTKLADCSSRDVETTELFIVEGQSAGGNAKQCRDAMFQAILPLQGKILNVEKARIAKMLSHAEIQTLILALGTGIGADEFDVAKRRYGKVIIMTDADVDGAHIRTLLLTFFFRHMQELIRDGYVYLAQPPLYRVRRKNREQYYLTDEDFRAALIELGLDGTTLTAVSDGATFSGSALRELVGLLLEMEDHERTLRKHGITLETLLANRREQDGKLPIFRVHVAGEHHFAHSEEEARLIAGRLAAERDDEEVEDGEAVLNGSLTITELHESRDIEKTLSSLERRGFPVADYFPDPDPDAPPKYRLSYENDALELKSISEIAPGIRTVGEKGIQIQRYKGLGEMNPDQLGVTTMSPESRTLLRVRLEDAVEADRLFSLLMGNAVQPRREFIEHHALEATNLDV
ncbi:MAG TPA: DNA topoisomerase (ATP-hydrolyzing) subunit B [Planctomycetota bacterium]|nr:DNA topoisomerase (ATP-hydrolyzing) subunit B [Planctomycetota bacterium]HRR78979.1 DNA topoisomerase (ATP-hydrolyzing) subunit B [Planctomycetota bacterium]HRT93427.1 DNA topoisomerase (ATP-hydrolyzing) subunit B [Planctomycetota bacterium]